MAYYTIANFLHKDTYGKVKADTNISPEDLTGPVWDYLFALTDDLPENSSISKDTLNEMRRSFTYWYVLLSCLAMIRLIGPKVSS
jgi:hypothetical protein